MSDRRGWPEKLGVPLNSERDGHHVVGMSLYHWDAGAQGWTNYEDGTVAGPMALAHIQYVGECLNPAEREALIDSTEKRVIAKVKDIAAELRDTAITDERDTKQELGKDYDHNSYGAGFNAGSQETAEQIIQRLEDWHGGTGVARK